MQEHLAQSDPALSKNWCVEDLMSSFVHFSSSLSDLWCESLFSREHRAGCLSLKGQTGMVAYISADQLTLFVNVCRLEGMGWSANKSNSVYQVDL